MWFILNALKLIFGEEQARVIAQALPAFITSVLGCALILSALVAWALRWRWKGVVAHKDARIESLEERVKLRDDRLIQNTSADEAHELIEALEARLDRLAPRRIPESTRPRILQALQPPSGTTWTIGMSWNPLMPDTEPLARELRFLFREAGWTISDERAMGFDFPAGITLTTRDPGDASDRAAREALRLTGLPIEEQRNALSRFPHIKIGHREA
jgi:hypothetical protein